MPMDDIEIPQYFICPISLQIMKDPVTAVTGITYDRESIEKWLKTSKDITCPVTRQVLPSGSDLTPNHTLRRLIQAWCTMNDGDGGVDKVPTMTKSPLCKTLLKLIREFEVPGLYVNALNKLEVLAKDIERNKKSIEEAGVAKALILLLIKCYKENKTVGAEQALRILCKIWTPCSEINDLLNENHQFINCLTWILEIEIENHVVIKTLAMQAVKRVIEAANTRLLEKLKPEFVKQMLRVLKLKISQQATKSALQNLIQICLLGRNKSKLVEANTIFELIELELENPEKNISELIFNLLAHLCSCAKGRAEFLRHAGSIAMVAKRILRVLPATDDQAVCILSFISKNAATKEVLLEMLRVGAVTKLCMVNQADCPTYLKQKARGVLRLHSNLWSDSPCIAVYLSTRYPR
ncbi:E3 ubiquitin-protein ligase PUB23-like [Hibiscus syriacus]|uniref:E3 ubiquitin-protein ligase PUB23-like n=1 Tax=Hibiscus syriacus TaxID=106335 RepID=UPI0019204B3D|nr:E3 ubiquitin-protein ligase PUB23-like [Hibiscus syriacus]